MFIRDLEHYQLEASNNQFDRVNGGMINYGYGYVPEEPTTTFPPFALSNFTVKSVARGNILAIVESSVETGVVTDSRGGAMAVLHGSSLAVAFG